MNVCEGTEPIDVECRQVGTGFAPASGVSCTVDGLRCEGNTFCADYEVRYKCSTSRGMYGPSPQHPCLSLCPLGNLNAFLWSADCFQNQLIYTIQLNPFQLHPLFTRISRNWKVLLFECIYCFLHTSFGFHLFYPYEKILSHIPLINLWERWK